jgi:exonuclease III
MQRSRVFVESRFLVCTIEYRDESYNIAVAHLQDQRNDPKGSARSDTLQDLVSKVRDLEAEQGCGNSIVIGDFNTDPFAEEMIKPTTLFSTMFKDVIVRRGVRSRRGKTCQMMYNPVISCLSESDGCYGSYYYDKDYSPLYWHFYDQIIVSGPLVDRVRQYEYLKHIGEKDLLRSGRPDKRVSDHLPLFAEIASLDYE